MDGIKATLTKRIGGVPAYVYYGAAVAVLAYVLVRRKQKALRAAAASAGDQPTSSQNASTTIPNAPVAPLSGLPWQFGAMPNYNPRQQSVQPVYTDTSQERLSGSGFNPPTVNPQGPIVTPQGTFEWVQSWDQVKALMSNSTQLWEQALPGYFSQVQGDPTKSLASGTAIYVQLSPPPNPAANAAVYGSPMAYATA